LLGCRAAWLVSTALSSLEAYARASRTSGRILLPAEFVGRGFSGDDPEIKKWAAKRSRHRKFGKCP
jgi:hypothetical protein